MGSDPPDGLDRIGGHLREIERDAESIKAMLTRMDERLNHIPTTAEVWKITVLTMMALVGLVAAVAVVFAS